MQVRDITPADDAALGRLVRYNLKLHGLDIPGTVYFDDGLDHLSDFYLSDPETRAYLVLADDADALVGGVGLAAFPAIDSCAELQKIYLSDAVKGQGWGHRLMELIERRARAMGFARMYLETHSNLHVAIHMYERCGYARVAPPEAVQHAAMDTFMLKEL